MPEDRVLVVGTTPDYVAHIRERYPTRALFVTDTHFRPQDDSAMAAPHDELFLELTDIDGIERSVTELTERMNWRVSGVACYDCEWLGLAARLSEFRGLPFPSTDAVHLARNKYLSKRRWAAFDIPCPKTAIVRNGQQAARFLEVVDGPIVIKPLAASGSELTFCCDDRAGVWYAMKTAAIGLSARQSRPMYLPSGLGDTELDPRQVIVAEQYVEGREYSCDFTIVDSRVSIVRIARKLRDPQLPFGTTPGYVVPGHLPDGLSPERLADLLGRAALALGLHRSVCMADFIVGKQGATILELTPRFGGDCLPQVIRHSCGIDTIGMALDFAERMPIAVPPIDQWKRMVGLRLFASRAGIIRSIDSSTLDRHPSVREVTIKRSAGHRIALPPVDYDSWLLGHVVFEPSTEDDLHVQCDRLLSAVHVIVESDDDQTPTRTSRPDSGVVRPADPSA